MATQLGTHRKPYKFHQINNIRITPAFDQILGTQRTRCNKIIHPIGNILQPLFCKMWCFDSSTTNRPIFLEYNVPLAPYQ